MQSRLPRETRQTRETMMGDMKNYVLNRDIPDTPNSHRMVYNSAHPEEPLRPIVDHVHHINGNHNDNRPENLEKVTEKTHAGKHAEMRRNNINVPVVYGGA